MTGPRAAGPGSFPPGDCRQILDALTEYLEGDLATGDERDFEQHMDGCHPCHAFFRTYRKSSELARQSLQEEDIPEEVRRRVRQYLRSKLGLK